MEPWLDRLEVGLTGRDRRPWSARADGGVELWPATGQQRRLREGQRYHDLSDHHHRQLGQVIVHVTRPVQVVGAECPLQSQSPV